MGATTDKGIWPKIILWSSVAAVVAFLALVGLADYATASALILAVLVGVLVAILLWIGWAPGGAVADVSAPVAATMPAAAPAPVSKPEPARVKPAESDASAAARAKAAAAMPGAALTAKPAARDGEPELLAAPRAGQADDLKQLKGVGPKLEATLNALGIFHFDQIAGWGPDEIAWVDERLQFRGRIDRDGWVGQAQILAAGGETDFSARVVKGDVY